MSTQILEREKTGESSFETADAGGSLSPREEGMQPSRCTAPAEAGTPNKAVIEIKELRVVYRGRGTGQPDRTAVKDLTLKVQPGEVFGFLGPNGAGKTTTMNVLLGFVNASSGEARLFGTDVREPIARQRIGYLPELTYYYKFLTAEELLRFYARIFRIPRAEAERRIDAVLKLVELEHARKRQIKTYSNQRPGPGWPDEGPGNHPTPQE
jgi:ABC-2 type transport system ATP-binding protein